MLWMPCCIDFSIVGYCLITWIETYAGKKMVMLEVSSKRKGGVMKASKRSLTSSGLEYKLDELRKELSSTHGGIFPHSVLSTQQITLLSAERPKSMEQVKILSILLSD